jgi:hypothetical protein
MSDFRDPLYRDPNNPTGNVGFEPGGNPGRRSWAWIGGAAVVVILLALAFGVRHVPNSRVATNAVPAPATSHPLAPPATTHPSATPPAIMVPPAPPAPTPNQ